MRHRGFYGLLYGFVLVAAVALAQDGTIVEETELCFAELRHRAEQGDAQAQYELGFRHSFSTGGRRLNLITGRFCRETPRNDAEAMRWYRKAAEQQYPEAQFALGHMYAAGRGVPQNDAEATKWYRLAADQGHEEAQDVLKGEIWRCFATSDYNNKTALFTLGRKRMGSSEFGRVLVASTTQRASFRIAGLNRRWNFGDDESGDSYPYAFIIKPDGTGLYYDFSTSADGTANASDSFNCLMSPLLIWGDWGKLK